MIPRLAPLRPDDRWRTRERGATLSSFAIAILLASLAFHVALIIFALLGPHPGATAPEEIPVEVVQEAPAPEKQRPAAAKPPPASPAKPDDQRAALEKQLADLKAEQQALKANDDGHGPLRDSIRALALPAVAENGDGEVVGYQDLVFSQLAKAKEGAHAAERPASVGVRFSVDANGALVDAAVAVSSGDASLDAESLAIVRRAAPFPKPPPGAEQSFSANFSYAGQDR